MGATRAKTEFLTKVRLERFLSRNLPNCWLVTITFHEDVMQFGCHELGLELPEWGAG
jgi:hypothetical protein